MRTQRRARSIFDVPNVVVKSGIRIFLLDDGANLGDLGSVLLQKIIHVGSVIYLVHFLARCSIEDPGCAEDFPSLFSPYDQGSPGPSIEGRPCCVCIRCCTRLMTNSIRHACARRLVVPSLPGQLPLHIYLRQRLVGGLPASSHLRLQPMAEPTRQLDSTTTM